MNRKPLIGIGVVATVVLIVVFRKQLRSWGKQIANIGGQHQIGKEIREAGKTGEEQSYPNSWYIDQANSLQALFEGCGVYVDENIVNIIKKCKNNTDWLVLKKKFGVRKFDGCNWEFNFGWDEGTLVQSLNGELSYDEVKEINDHFKSVGIGYTI